MALAVAGRGWAALLRGRSAADAEQCGGQVRSVARRPLGAPCCWRRLLATRAARRKVRRIGATVPELRRHVEDTSGITAARQRFFHRGVVKAGALGTLGVRTAAE